MSESVTEGAYGRGWLRMREDGVGIHVYACVVMMALQLPKSKHNNMGNKQVMKEAYQERKIKNRSF